MRDTKIHRRAEELVTEYISEYIADMSDDDLYVYVKEVFLMDANDDYVGLDSEIAINCAMALKGRAEDVDNERDHQNLLRQYNELMDVLEGLHNIITRADMEEITA